MIPVVVLTCPREGGFEYLDRTIAALDRERADVDFDGYVICDNSTEPESPTVPEGWRYLSYKRPEGTIQGNKHAYFEALAAALRLGDGDALVFEDDIELCRGALRRMSTFPIPRDCDFLMFFAPAVLQGAQSFPGLWRTPTPVMGTQAIKFARKALVRLVEWRSSVDFQKFRSSDQSLELARILLGLKYAAHCPELVQHVGSVSADSPGIDLDGLRWRRALTFSPKLDAMALYARDDLYR